MFMTLVELFRLIFVTVALGFIFSDIVRRPKDITEMHKRFDWADLKYAMIIAAPAVILHELGHKFTAILFGLNTEFFASYFGLGLGMLLKVIGSPIVFFVPGYVSISGANMLQSAEIAFMGPFMNLALWIGAVLILKYRKNSNNASIMLYATKRINMILFFFNMIPIPPFDGGHVLLGLLGYFGI